MAEGSKGKGNFTLNRRELIISKARQKFDQNIFVE